VSHTYVPSLLQTTYKEGGRIHPRILWEKLDDLLGSGLYHASYSPFHDWVQLAASNGIGVANTFRADAAWEPCLIAPDASLGASRTSMECAIFPAAASSTPSAPGNLQGVVDMLAAMRYDAAHQANETAEQNAVEKARKASPTAQWGTSRVQQLCNLCQCDNKLDLLPIYLEMAENGSKHDHHTMERYASTPVELVVTRNNTVPFCRPGHQPSPLSLRGKLGFRQPAG
jgi:hypothetical protein